MSVSLGVRLAILAPTIFFLVTYIWSDLLNGHHYRTVRDKLGLTIPAQKELLMTIIGSHYYEAIFAEAILLFAVNGLIITHELESPVNGTLLMVAGIVFAVSGLIDRFVNETRTPAPKSFRYSIVPVMFLAAGELGFMLRFEPTESQTIPIILFFAFGIFGGLIMNFHLNIHYKAPQTQPV